ncbi:hypothetical protein [Ornithinimicrobium murale]|uniref:hypothetical protein n=1 Tax=Ornithinimicrobium murale TaxID=1050153 RepID=UPI000E0DCBD5|nr:hypothetical protein [Ornithinimicrobium murale]
MPTKPDGASWNHAMVFSQDGQMQMAVADTAGELLALVIDDYPTRDASVEDLVELDAARIDYGIRLAQGIQESWLASAVTEGALELGQADPRDVDAWFRAKDSGVDVGQWSRDVPLVCLDMAYEPFTDTPAPTGNVAWVEVRDELSLLNSMSQLGLIGWFTPESADA